MKQDNKPANIPGILALTGLIMVFAPINTVLLMLICLIYRKSEMPFKLSLDGPSGVFIQSSIPLETISVIGFLMFLCGLIILATLGIRRFHRSIRS